MPVSFRMLFSKNPLLQKDSCELEGTRGILKRTYVVLELGSQRTAVMRGALITYMLLKITACCLEAVQADDETAVCKDLHFSPVVQTRKLSVYVDSEVAVFVVAE